MVSSQTKCTLLQSLWGWKPAGVSLHTCTYAASKLPSRTNMQDPTGEKYIQQAHQLCLEIFFPTQFYGYRLSLLSKLSHSELLWRWTNFIFGCKDVDRCKIWLACNASSLQFFAFLEPKAEKSFCFGCSQWMSKNVLLEKSLCGDCSRHCV